MDLFVPDIYQKSIYTIDYEALFKRGIKCLLFDLDNTISPINIKEINPKIKDLIVHLKILGFKIIIVSNSPKKRVEPFKEKLNIDSACNSKKPFKTKYKKIMRVYDYKDYEIAAIGDQLLTDIFGANRMKFTSILVNPISEVDSFSTKLNRMIEKNLYKIMEKRGILKKGLYYE